MRLRIAEEVKEKKNATLREIIEEESDTINQKGGVVNFYEDEEKPQLPQAEKTPKVHHMVEEK